MADHSKPTTASRYDTQFIPEISGRIDDAIELNYVAGTNLPEHAVKFDRTNSKFQEWVSAAWVDMKVSAANGISGLGTIATQNANSVAITGGSMSGVTLNASDISSGTLNAARLADSGATPNTYGDGNNVPVITVDAKGRITTITTTPAGAAGVPSGMIAVFKSACPTGWTRETSFDGYFLRGAAAYNSTPQGSSSHVHTMNAHSHTLSSHTHTVNSHNHSFSGSGTSGGPSQNLQAQTASGGGNVGTNAHTHSTTISGTTGNASPGTGGPSDNATSSVTSTMQAGTSHLPPFLDIVFCRKN